MLFIHARLIAETGGEHGILDLGSVQSAVARPQATFGKKDLYPDLFSKAAGLLESLVKNHAFIDGNKRTAITAVGIFLSINRYKLTANNRELERFTIECAKGSMSVDQIRSWLITHGIRSK